MKKLISFMLVAVLCVSALFALTACDGGEKSDVEIAIEKAQKMSLAELEAAAKAEFDANPEAVFQADSLTSGIKKVVAAMEEKYSWFKGAYNSKKGSEYQPKLTAAYTANEYIADFVMIQDASFVKSLADEKFLLSYVPSGEEFNIAEGDKSPLVGVTFNKVFMYYNTKVGKEQLKNVWQMTGVDGATLKGVHNVSYQNPLGEDINMSFLIMLTSPDACAKLTTAYKAYFGAEYDPSKDDYENIGFKFVAEFIKNVGYWHSSDSSEVKKISDYADDGRIIFAGLCKLKDYPGYKAATETAGFYKEVITAGGYNNEIVGFPGFVYNMWTLIPSTAKMPYTACLFTRYLLSEEGYAAGWGGVLGYYSSNQKIASVEGDPALSVWKQKAIVEDVEYINTVYGTAVKFINQQLASK